MKWKFYPHAKYECPDCHEQRFVRMINEKGEFYPENVGRCDRENTCGYMYHASQWLKDNPTIKQMPITIKSKPAVKRIINGYYSFDLSLYEQLKEDANRYNKKYRSWDSSYTCEFTNYLIEVLHFNRDFIGEMMNRYKMYEKVELFYENFYEPNALIKSRTSVVYYYVSINGDIRAIEQIYYNGFKRSKTFDNSILNKHLSNWGKYDMETTEINWCLFGEHLILEFPDKPIIVTEGVKTAFGMALFYPQYNWLATGSSNRLVHLNFETNQKVHFLPDAGFIKDKSYAQIWKDKVRKTYGVNFKYDIYEFNDDCSSDEIKSGCDILDLQIKDPERAKEIIMKLITW